jgi:hypothetical protein
VIQGTRRSGRRRESPWVVEPPEPRHLDPVCLTKYSLLVG